MRRQNLENKCKNKRSGWDFCDAAWELFDFFYIVFFPFIYFWKLFKRLKSAVFRECLSCGGFGVEAFWRALVEARVYWVLFGLFAVSVVVASKAVDKQLIWLLVISIVVLFAVVIMALGFGFWTYKQQTVLQNMPKRKKKKKR